MKLKYASFLLSLHKRINMEANFQADINWIQSEVAKIRDPELILAFKSLLKYRNKKSDIDFGAPLTKTQFVNEIKEAESQIEKGDYLSLEDFEKQANQW